MFTKANTLFSAVLLLYVATQGLAAPNPQASETPVLYCTLFIIRTESNLCY